MAKIDIVVPCYNYGRFLEACVRSVLMQSIRDVRILIIDDASSDNSALVAQRLAAEDPRVTVSIHAENRGHIETYNEGIDWADSDYFLLLSADDLLVPGAFQRATTIMDGNPQVVLTHGLCINWQDNSPLPEIDADPRYSWHREDLVRDMCVAGHNLVVTPTAIGRTVVQKAIGGYRASLPHSADMQMWLHFGARGSVAKIEAVQAIYRKHSSNMSDAYYSEEWGDYWHRKAAFDSFFEETGSCEPEFQSLRARASLVLAEQAFQSGAALLRSGVRFHKRDRISRGVRLIRLATTLNPRLRYSTAVWELLRMPGTATTREWAVSAMRRAAGKLYGSVQRN
jgi:glycosyltransferase involved in cell wall biosynthesis